MSTEQSADIVIIGAGVVGLAAALAIAPTNLNILVLDAQSEHVAPSEDRSLDGWARRVTALTPASTEFLSDLGVWHDVLESNRAGAYTDMVVWDAEGTGLIEFDARELSLKTLGFIAEATVTTDALVRRVNQTANISLLWDTRLENLKLDKDADNDAITLSVSSGLEIKARLAIGADGGRSVSRELSGIRTRDWSYGQQAIVATVRVQPEHAATCWQAFLPTGPLALLPLADNDVCSIVWSLDNDVCSHWVEAEDSEFIEGLNSALGGRGPVVTSVSKRQVFPLVQSHAVDYWSERFVLVGDAAHAIHPLAGQGINLGLSDAKVLGEEIVRMHARRADWSAVATLKSYERRRKGDNLAMMTAMQAFKWGFGNRNPAATMLRNLGLTTTNTLPMLKRWLMKQAVGVE